MPTELRQALHQAAAAPAGPLDLAHLLARGRRRRRNRRIGAAAGALVATGVVASLGLVVPPPQQPPPEPGPAGFGELPTGWTELSAPPAWRATPAAVATDEQLLVWGGEGPGDTGTVHADGFRFDLPTGRWQDMAPSPLAARSQPAAAWTGRELLVWGGADGGRRYGDGAGYDPERDTWRRLPPAPISARAPLSVWTGTELIVWGTAARTGDIPADGAAYHPDTDSWRRIAAGPVELTDATAVWTGREMIVFGAALGPDNRPATETAIGAAYQPATDTWRRLPDSPLSPQASTAAWNGTELVAWDYLVEAAAYDPATDEWRRLPSPPLDPMECVPASAPVAGGGTFGDFCGGMVRFDSGSDSWRTVPAGPVPRTGFVELVAAGPVVLLLERSTGDGPALLAYRPG